MSLCDERPAAGRTVRETVVSVLCQTMPTAAVASGLCSAVDVTPVVDRLYAAYADEKLASRTPDDLGLTVLTEWLAARGEVVGRAVAKQLRERLMREALRRAVAAGSPAAVHVRPA